jgi:hypothetical protein
MNEAKRFDAALRAIVRRLRNLVDAADERVHAWEVLLRKENSQEATPWAIALPRSGDTGKRARANSITRSKAPRRHHVTAAEFDLRFAR